MDHPPPMAASEPPPPPASADPVEELARRLGLRLEDRVTGLAALTHKSYVNEHRGEGLTDNERLEFLGDAVIDLAVSHRLMERFPAAREGDLSKMRAAVVDEQGLAAMARSLDLGGLLRLGRGEELTGGRRKASLLADAMEAVVAAVYLEAGLPGVLGLVDRLLGEAFAAAAAGTLDRDFKTQLQEVAQARFRATPRYRVAAESGPDHAKVFEVELELRGEVLGRATGRSKKDAEQAVARLGLEALARQAAEVAATAMLEAAPPGLEPVGEVGAAGEAAGEGEGGSEREGVGRDLPTAGEVEPPAPATPPARAPARRKRPLRKKAAAATRPVAAARARRSSPASPGKTSPARPRPKRAVRPTRPRSRPR